MFISLRALEFLIRLVIKHTDTLCYTTPCTDVLVNQSSLTRYSCSLLLPPFSNLIFLFGVGLFGVPNTSSHSVGILIGRNHRVSDISRVYIYIYIYIWNLFLFLDSIESDLNFLLSTWHMSFFFLQLGGDI